MGQSNSQPAGQSLAQARPSTATQELELDAEERARIQTEERERRAAAAQQRMVSQQKRGGNSGGASMSGVAKKKPSALEQMSAENRGWRTADEQAELRSWN